jgi:hypothetical protein
MWRTKRGRDLARRVAFRDLPYGDCLRLPLFLNATTMLQRMTLSGEPSEDQEQLTWDLARTVFDAYSSERLKLFDIFQMAIPFLTPTASARPEILPEDPALRGPLAYLFGLRCKLVCGPREAEPFFAEALKGTDQDARLYRLARKELESIRGPKP